MDTNAAEAQTDPTMAEDQATDTPDNTQDESLGGDNNDFLAYEDQIEALRLGENQDEAPDDLGGQEGIVSDEEQEITPDATEETQVEGEVEEEVDAEAEATESDEQETEDESETRKPNRYRFNDLSDVEHRAMELKKRNADLSLAECIDIATQEIEPESQAESVEAVESESSKLKVQITELREKYNQHMDDYDVDEAKAVNVEIEALRDQLQDASLAEAISGVESRLDARRSEESYDQSLQSSWEKAAEAYPDFANPDSSLAKLASKIAKANSFDDAGYNESPDKPFLAAKEAAEILGLNVRKVASPVKQTEQRPNFPARGGSKTATQTTQPNNIEQMIDAVNSPDDYDALMERMEAAAG